LEITHAGATLFGPGGDVLRQGIGVHQTALYDMASATLLFLFLYVLSRSSRRPGILTLTFGAWYGAMRIVEDSVRVDKRFFGLTGSQWTGMTVSAICLVTLVAWALASRRRTTVDALPGRDGGTPPPAAV
ncbi:MAG TPA: prolipoprotein diacylglyceryl transferase family protein, partial [Actinomycetota bacterium]|nr:prolipoprotein diacylglyceryl transferase family protein [Actinomycetota bacterium]